MDLLIGCLALAQGAALVTRNGRHFQRIPDLEVPTYQAGGDCVLIGDGLAPIGGTRGAGQRSSL